MFVKIDKKWQKWYKSVKNDQTEYIYTCQEGSLFTDIHHLITTVITLSLTHLDLVPNFRPIPNHLALWSGSRPSLEFRTFTGCTASTKLWAFKPLYTKDDQIAWGPNFESIGDPKGTQWGPSNFCERYSQSCVIIWCTVFVPFILKKKKHYIVAAPTFHNLKPKIENRDLMGPKD